MQLALDPAQEAATLSITIHRSVSDYSGYVAIAVANEAGQTLATDRIGWRKPHDLVGLPELAKAVTDTFMWGRPTDVLLAFRVAFRKHVADLEAAAEGEVRRVRKHLTRKV